MFIGSTDNAGEQAELEQRFVYQALRNRPANVPIDALARVNHGRVANWAPSIISTGEFLEFAATLRRVFTSARSVSASDLIPVGGAGAGPGGFDLAEITSRADAVVAALRTAQAQLESAGTADLDVVRERLLRLASLGMATAVPVSAAGGTETDRANLLDQARRIAKDALDRLQRVEALPLEPAASAQPQIAHQVERMRLVLGSEFQALPLLVGADVRELKLSLQASTALQGGDAFAASVWLGQMARVREDVRELSDALRYTEAIAGRVNTPQVAQLPHRTGDRWVALPAGVRNGRTSLIVFGGPNAVAGQPLAGMVFDEWNETVPRARETTGVAFHYDAPAARPPQAILLAVAPDLSRVWDVETMEAILLETFELATLRAVDQESLTLLDQYLPALYFALNAGGDTISTNFREA